MNKIRRIKIVHNKCFTWVRIPLGAYEVPDRVTSIKWMIIVYNSICKINVHGQQFPRIYSLIAQLVERTAVNRGVIGSSPIERAPNFKIPILLVWKLFAGFASPWRS